MRALGLSWVAVFAVATAGLCVGQACGKEDRAPMQRPYFPSSGGSGGDGFNGYGGGPCVAEGLCGNEIHKISFDVPNVYFVFDRSGSMEELAPPSYDSRFRVVREAAIEMIKSLGPLINIGAAVFPHGNLDVDPCSPGNQVFPMTPGDPIEQDGGEGPTTQAFRANTNVQPNGGTPISATMFELTPTLSALDGHTIVMLLTDGGPNCNYQITCDIGGCQPNIEGVCPATENCCDVNHPQGGPQLCVDRDASEAAIAGLAALGIDVYVIGIPGSQYYDSVLDDLAVAGGTAQQNAATKYHRVDDFELLSGVLGDIAAEAISCELPLVDPPDSKDFTNVYLDCELLPFDPVNGWGWLGDDTVWLHGEACAKLKGGQVTQVQIVTGCPTELPK